MNNNDHRTSSSPFSDWTTVSPVSGFFVFVVWGGRELCMQLCSCRFLIFTIQHSEKFNCFAKTTFRQPLIYPCGPPECEECVRILIRFIPTWACLSCRRKVWHRRFLMCLTTLTTTIKKTKLKITRQQTKLQHIIQSWLAITYDAPLLFATIRDNYENLNVSTYSCKFVVMNLSVKDVKPLSSM